LNPNKEKHISWDLTTNFNDVKDNGLQKVDESNLFKKLKKVDIENTFEPSNFGKRIDGLETRLEKIEEMLKTIIDSNHYEVKDRVK